MRRLGIPLGAGATLLLAAGVAARGAEFSEDLEEARKLVRSRPREALEKLGPILEKARGNAHAEIQVRRVRADAFRRLRQHDSAIAEYEAVAGLAGPDTELRKRMIFDVAKCYADSNRASEAVKRIEAAILSAEFGPEAVVKMRFEQAELHRRRLKDYTSVLQKLKEVLGQENLRTRDAVKAHRMRAEAYKQLREYDSAIREYERAIGLAGDDRRAVRDMILAVSRAYGSAGRAREAIEYLERPPEGADVDRETRARMRLEQASIWISALKNGVEAAKACESVVHEFPEVRSAVEDARRRLVEARLHLAGEAIDRRELEDAQSQYDRAWAVYGNLMSNAKDSGRLVACLRLMLRDMCGAYLGLGEYSKALVAAKRYYDTAGNARELEEAVRLVAQALKGVDGNLAGVNAFLKFQRSGPAGPDGTQGTADDLEDPLAETRKPAGRGGPADGGKAILRKCLDGLGYSPEDRRSRGYVLLALGEARAAMSELKHAYLMCPTDDRRIKRAVNDVLVGLRALNGHVFAGDTFVEYHQYGPKGEDAASNLEDPLKDF